MLTELYNPSLALLTDLYQLTMAYGYWKLERAEQEAVFHLFFRKPPFAGGYAVAAGLGPVLEYLEAFQFDPSDLAYLETLTGNDDQPLFDKEFLDYLGALRLTVAVDAMPEGTLAFAHEPLLRVQGPILQCQLLETPLLNMINFQTLVATKASRITSAAGADPVLEFGLRRAQGIDGSLSASRAAYMGGCGATSNVLAGKLLGIPVKGTHAHSWVMSFDTEAESFKRYAEVMPNNSLFLVDTYDTLDGVRTAIETGRWLRQQGHEMLGIRLDSGDLAYLSIEARKLLDDAGFPDAQIVASNDLDETLIENLKHQGAKIGVWGVGTRLSTAYDQPALGGVYKLGALRDESGQWQPKIKLSEQTIKTSIPGILQVRRFEKEGRWIADMIFDDRETPGQPPILVDPASPNRRKKVAPDANSFDLLQPVFRNGAATGVPDSLATLRDRARKNLERLHPSCRRFLNPHEYPVGLDVTLHERRDQMIRDARAL